MHNLWMNLVENVFEDGPLVGVDRFAVNGHEIHLIHAVARWDRINDVGLCHP